MENRNRITYLFDKYFDGTATVQERKELATYLQSQKEELENLIAKAWENYTSDKKVFTSEESEAMVKRVLQAKNNGIRHRTIRFRIAVAAGIILAITSTAYWFYNQQMVPNAPVIASAPTHHKELDFDPGGDKAILTLGDGS